MTRNECCSIPGFYSLTRARSSREQQHRSVLGFGLREADVMNIPYEETSILIDRNERLADRRSDGTTEHAVMNIPYEETIILIDRNERTVSQGVTPNVFHQRCLSSAELARGE